MPTNVATFSLVSQSQMSPRKFQIPMTGTPAHDRFEQSQVHRLIPLRAEQLLDRDANIFCDLAQQDRRNIPTFVEWQCGAPTVRMAKLLVRISLS